MKTEKSGLGQTIENVIQQKALRKEAVAKRAGISPQRLNGWLKKNDLYVNDLFTLCKALDYDFFEPYRLNNAEPHQEAKVTVQIEVTGEKKKEVLRLLGNKDLYDFAVDSEDNSSPEIGAESAQKTEKNENNNELNN